MAFAYDGGGRITNFNGNGYHYSSGPVHGVNSIGVKNFIYDNNGNQIQSDDRTLEYSAFNKTKRMYRNTTSVEFEYDNNNNRYKRTNVGLDENETTYYVGNVEFITKDNGEVINKRYIGDTVISHYLNTQIKEIKYLHKDHLGSIQSVTDQSYNSLTTSHLSYDAYGRRRDAGNNTTVLDQNPIADVTKRGFTGQEHVDQLGIINYNARLYDPELGIMLQVDTVIPDGPVTQSMNRYSYVFNNPLSYTDPTGHIPAGATFTSDELLQVEDSLGSIGTQGQPTESSRTDATKQVLDNGAGIEGTSNGTFGGHQGNGLGGNDEFTGMQSDRTNGAMSAAFRVAFNDLEGGIQQEKPPIVAGIYGAGKNGGDNPFLESLVTDLGGKMFKANQEGAIVDYLTAGADDGRDVLIYGYSRGGNAAINVTNKLGKNGITVSNLITFDPHSLSSKKVFNLKYNNVLNASNFYQRNPRSKVPWFIPKRITPTGNNPYWGNPVSSKFIQVNEVNFTGQNFAPGIPVSHLNIVEHANKNN